MEGGAQEPSRRHDLDWLRVIAFGLLILYHVGMVFVSWEFHIKNPETSPALEKGMQFVNQWRLPLLFVISGAAVQFSLRRRGAWQFARERLVRLGIPLVFGMVVIVPPQVYYERLFAGAGYASILDFYPHAFDGIYPEGNLSWHHLWYVAYVLVYSLLLLPLFRFLQGARGARAGERIAAVLARPGCIYLLLVPLAGSDILLRPFWPTTHNLVADWANFSHSLILFMCGFVICSSERLWLALERQRWWALAAGIASVTSLYGVFWRYRGEPPPLGHLAYHLVKNANMLSWLIVACGFTRRHLDRPGRVIRYANEAVYPFYILHQTVIVALGYHVVGWDLGVAAKFSVLAAGTFGITWVLYETVVRRTDVTRLLFGLRPGARG